MYFSGSSVVGLEEPDGSCLLVIGHPAECEGYWDLEEQTN
jgi:hypothetical protein